MPLPDAVLRRSFGVGEREALALAIEIQAERILLDDRPARRVALELKLLVTGTAGILLVAKRHALVRSIRPYLDSLIEKSLSHRDQHRRGDYGHGCDIGTGKRRKRVWSDEVEALRVAKGCGRPQNQDCERNGETMSVRSGPTMSAHFAVLREAGLVDGD
jgi:hypothetical protein